MVASTPCLAYNVIRCNRSKGLFPKTRIFGNFFVLINWQRLWEFWTCQISKLRGFCQFVLWIFSVSLVLRWHVLWNAFAVI